MLQPVRGLPKAQLVVTGIDLFRSSPAYQRLQEGANPFAATRQTRFMGKTLQWYRHTRTEMARFQVTAG